MTLLFLLGFDSDLSASGLFTAESFSETTAIHTLTLSTVVAIYVYTCTLDISGAADAILQSFSNLYV